MDEFLIISIGAVLGANARYLVNGWVINRMGNSFPHGTFLINFTGSLLLGFFLSAAAEHPVINPRWYLFIGIGFLGAFTTFSTYVYESFILLYQGQWGLGLLNIFNSTALGIIAIGLGFFLGKQI
ncbi:fluoride efflux transporter CrcB [Pelolinea submarina]|uniref:Fluoride-specific ion channel FluC n=1 Tax=Pelolinea submarina TaxID=913107 RepID=A0A347ZSH3_9CHLR|nr:fluoride efflux transporter CrcB [Pelolinea submarina]REG11179.1 camphor resistance protein CrcB [Pelolinea submarina]BBB48254.1 CrcB protein [Pelolinea submarina]